MPKSSQHHVTVEVGPKHEVVTVDDLPALNETRWGPRRKAQVVAAVQARLLSFREARQRYQLSLEEFLSWRRAIYQDGIGGLKSPRRRSAAQATGLR